MHFENLTLPGFGLVLVLALLFGFCRSLRVMLGVGANPFDWRARISPGRRMLCIGGLVFVSNLILWGVSKSTNSLLYSQPDSREAGGAAGSGPSAGGGRVGTLPPWYDGADLCSLGDGIPDEFRRWTHLDVFTPDGSPAPGYAASDDIDGDGLDNLAEFWTGTDPLMAHTVNPYFTDGELAAWGLDPFEPTDFTAHEPLSEFGGIGIWFAQGYFYGTAPDAEGFDQSYAAFCLEAAGTNNFDVLVRVNTTRSVALSWGAAHDAAKGIVVAAPGAQYRLRFPCGADVALSLIPYPGADVGAPPPDVLGGEFWLAEFDVKLFYRAAGRASEDMMLIRSGATDAISGEAEFLRKESVGAKHIARYFPPSDLRGGGAEVGGVFASASGGKSRRDGRDWLTETIRNGFYKMFSDYPYAWHGSDDRVGPFWLTNIVGVAAEDITWTAQNGSMYPPTGYASTLIAHSSPFVSGDILVHASYGLSNETARASVAVPKCPRKDFAVKFSTDNFSPHMYEEFDVVVTFPGCPHGQNEMWLEIEVMRETTAGWQHVAWIDADTETPGVQRHFDATALNGGTWGFFWDGIATESAPLAKSPDVFTQGKEPFNRLLPQVIAGEPVPPPYYTVFARLKSAATPAAPILEEAQHTVYVPQVCKVEMSQTAYLEFCRPAVYPYSDWPDEIGKTNPLCEVGYVLYSGSTSLSKFDVENLIVENMRSLIPETVNVIVTRLSVRGRYKTIKYEMKKECPSIITGARGYTVDASWLNENPEGIGYVYVDTIRREPCDYFLQYNDGFLPPKVQYAPGLVPFNHLTFTKGVMFTGTHEFYHTLGLVGKNLFGSTQDGLEIRHNNWKNDTQSGHDESWIMNPGGHKHKHIYDVDGGKWNSIKPLNKLYMEFILPREKKQ